jgi:putative copper resistance protein D
VLRGFSTLAAWSVAVLAGSGVLNAWFMTNGLRSFLGTEYGELVLVKVALFIVMLGFGAANRYWLTPRLLPTGAATEEDNRSLRLLSASVSLEIALGLVVICVVALLGQLPPPGHEHHMD